jgi:hypothetical protein
VTDKIVIPPEIAPVSEGLMFIEQSHLRGWLAAACFHGRSAEQPEWGEMGPVSFLVAFV